MKMTRPKGEPRRGSRIGDAGRRGMAIIVVLVVLAVLAALLSANARMLAHLKSEILLIEKRQQQKYSTNAVERLPKPPAQTGPVAPPGAP